MGDAEAGGRKSPAIPPSPGSIEGSLLACCASDLAAQVLVVGHHGSKTSTSGEFVEAVSPDIAVISAGRNNSYGNPHREVLDNLAGVNIFRTDLSGDIKIISDGENYAVK